MTRYRPKRPPPPLLGRLPPLLCEPPLLKPPLLREPLNVALRELLENELLLDVLLRNEPLFDELLRNDVVRFAAYGLFGRL